MKPLSLSDVPKRCFQGILPSVIATCDANGVPNVTYLSQVFFVDERRVALSCQFFNKTKQNVLANPRACVQVYDPTTVEAYRIVLRFDHAESEGQLFDRMAVRIAAIASHTGMAGVFKLLSADVYEVVSVEKTEGFLEDAPEGMVVDDPPVYRSEVVGLQLVAQRASRAKDLEGLLTTVLETLAEAFGFEHSMVLLLDETGSRLYAIASRGYRDGGIGAEVGVGEGLIGTVARERCVLRVAGVGSELRYGRAIRASVQRAGGRSLAPEIPLPGLVDAQSQLALPLVVGDRLIGVIAVESRSPGTFEEWHETYLEIIAGQVAFAIENMIRRERDAEVVDAAPPATSAEPQRSVLPCPEPRTRRFRFYRNDDCVFADDEYLIRNVPGRILWKVLRTHAATGRTDFTNRELRLDPSLGLPAVRDNLESRLVLLRKRLQQKCPDIALVSTGRGQFRLETAGPIALEELESSV